MRSRLGYAFGGLLLLSLLPLGLGVWGCSLRTTEAPAVAGEIVRRTLDWEGRERSFFARAGRGPDGI